jgi:CRP-like cAMP-binding protein
MSATPDRDLTTKLGAVSLFGALAGADLASIATLVSPFEAHPGHVLVQPGMVGSGLFLIEEGTVTLTVQDRELELGPGEFFGELALLDDRAVRTTRVRARTPVRGYCINRDDFIALLEAEPKIALVMLRVLAHRLVDLITHQ